MALSIKVYKFNLNFISHIKNFKRLEFDIL